MNNKKKLKDFPFEVNEIVMYPDTESEYVDVGIGMVKVAESDCKTECRVVKRGRGLALKLIYDGYTEAFHKKGGFISLHDYLEYFGDFDELEAIGIWNPITKEPNWGDEEDD